LRGFGRATRTLGAGLEQRLHRFGAARPDSDFVATLQQIERHRAPHDAEADKADLHIDLHELEATILAEAASDELYKQAMFVQFAIAFEILSGTRLAWMSMTGKMEFYPHSPRKLLRVPPRVTSTMYIKLLTAPGCYYLKQWWPSTWLDSSVTARQVGSSGLGIEGISVMQELTPLSLWVVLSCLVVATISPIVQRWFISRKK